MDEKYQAWKTTFVDKQGAVDLKALSSELKYWEEDANASLWISIWNQHLKRYMDELAQTE